MIGRPEKRKSAKLPKFIQPLKTRRYAKEIVKVSFVYLSVLGGERSGKRAKKILLEPAAAVSHPPRDIHDGNARAQRPPERQNKIRQHSEHGQRQPENLALHSLDCKSFVLIAIPITGLPKNFSFAVGRCRASYDRNQVLALSSSITL